MLRIGIFLLLVGLPAIAFSYIPGLGAKEGVAVSDPTPRHLYFGELKDEGAVFRFTLPEQSTIFLNLLTPKSVNKDGKFDAVIVSESQGKVMGVLDAGMLPWEEYRDDALVEDFLRGPELSLPVPPGEYRVVVTSPGNTGKFALVIGNKERFSLSDMFALYQMAPKLKRDYFETSTASFLGSFIGVFFATLFILFGVLLSFLIDRGGYFGRVMRWLFGKHKDTPYLHFILALGTGIVGVCALSIVVISDWNMWVIVFSGAILYVSHKSGMIVYRVTREG